MILHDLLNVRRTGHLGLVGSDTEGVTGSNPVAPTNNSLTSGNAGQVALLGEERQRLERLMGSVDADHDRVTPADVVAEDMADNTGRIQPLP
jgi:hypothetical protein